MVSDKTHPGKVAPFFCRRDLRRQERLEFAVDQLLVAAASYFFARKFDLGWKKLQVAQQRYDQDVYASPKLHARLQLLHHQYAQALCLENRAELSW